MTNQLLLIVDVQNGFITDPACEAIVPKIVELVDKFGVDNCLASRFINPADGNWEKLMDWHSMKTEPDISLPAELAKLNMLTIDKFTYLAWGEPLEKILNDRNVETVYICGIDTDQCVLTTAADIFSHSRRPVVITDCCASSAGDIFHEVGLKLLKRLIGAKQLFTHQQVMS